MSGGPRGSKGENGIEIRSFHYWCSLHLTSYCFAVVSTALL